VVPPDDLVGKTLIEGCVRQNFGVTVLAIRRQAEDPRLPRKVIITTGDERILKDDRLLVFGPDIRIDAISHD
jgi:Trk K+ transport system NAD-binding subunit